VGQAASVQPSAAPSRAGESDLPHLVAKAGVLALLILPIVSDDWVKEFPTVAHELGAVLYENWWKLLAPDAPSLRWLTFNTIEVLIGMTTVTVFWQAVRDRRGPVLPFDLVAATAFLSVVAIMFAFGMASGGSLKPALWQVRPYVHLVAIALLVPQVLRTLDDLKLAVYALNAAILLKACWVIGIFVFAAGAEFTGWRELVGHEDSVFFAASIFFAVSVFAYDKDIRVRAATTAVSLVLVAALVLNLRRAAYVALALNLLLLPAFLHGRRRLAAGMLAAFAGTAAVYLSLFWNAVGSLGVPATKIRSILTPGEGLDASSNVYRVSENLNLWAMVRDHPFGTGFGIPFREIYPMADISDHLPYWDYDPHNMVFGLWMFLGFPGFVVFLCFYANCIVSAGYLIRSTACPFRRSAAVFCLTALVSGLIVTALDMFVWTQRGALFLGGVVGLLAALAVEQQRGSVASTTGSHAIR
jgi:hypothetical protein